MQINRTSPPVGFIIIRHFNEVATDIETTRSPRVVFRRGGGERRDRHQMAQAGTAGTRKRPSVV